MCSMFSAHIYGGVRIVAKSDRAVPAHSKSTRARIGGLLGPHRRSGRDGVVQVRLVVLAVAPTVRVSGRGSY